MKRWRSFRMERFNGIQIAAACNSEVVSRIVVLDRAMEREPGSLFSSSCVSLLFDRKVKSRGYTKNPFETINQSPPLSPRNRSDDIPSSLRINLSNNNSRKRRVPSGGRLMYGCTLSRKLSAARTCSQVWTSLKIVLAFAVRSRGGRQSRPTSRR